MSRLTTRKNLYKTSGIVFNEHGNALKEHRDAYDKAKTSKNPSVNQKIALEKVSKFEDTYPKGVPKKHDFLSWEYIYQLSLLTKKSSPAKSTSRSPSRSKSTSRSPPKTTKSTSRSSSRSKSPPKATTSPSRSRKSKSKSKSPLKLKTAKSKSPIKKMEYIEIEESDDEIEVKTASKKDFISTLKGTSLKQLQDRIINRLQRVKEGSSERDLLISLQLLVTSNEWLNDYIINEIAKQQEDSNTLVIDSLVVQLLYDGKRPPSAKSLLKDKEELKLVLIPFNETKKHWRGYLVVIDVKKNAFVYDFDSIQRKLPRDLPNYLKNFLIDLLKIKFVNEPKLIELSYYQKDESSCGVFVSNWIQSLDKKKWMKNIPQPYQYPPNARLVVFNHFIQQYSTKETTQRRSPSPRAKSPSPIRTPPTPKTRSPLKPRSPSPQKIIEIPKQKSPSPTKTRQKVKEHAAPKKKTSRKEPKMRYMPFRDVGVVTSGVWGPYPSPNYLSY